MAMRTLIKLWFEYVTIWIKNNGKKTVDVFATEQFQMEQFLYWYIFG